MKIPDGRCLVPTLLLVPAAMFVLACSVKAPPRTSWALSPGVGSSRPQLDPDGLALGVTRFTAASDVRTMALTWRDAEGRLIHETADSWTDYPDRMIEEMAMTQLLRSGRFRSVTSAPPRDGLDEVLSCRVVEFGEWDAGGVMETRVVLRWQISGPEGSILRSGEAAGRASVAAKSMSAVVAAYSEATNAALEELSRGITASP